MSIEADQIRPASPRRYRGWRDGSPQIGVRFKDADAAALKAWAASTNQSVSDLIRSIVMPELRSFTAARPISDAILPPLTPARTRAYWQGSNLAPAPYQHHASLHATDGVERSARHAPRNGAGSGEDKQTDTSGLMADRPKAPVRSDQILASERPVR